MQLILSGFAFVANTFKMYLIANLILMLYGERASEKKKWIFAFFTGTLLQTAFVYAVYIVGGALTFSSMVYLVVVTPNPVFALLYCFIGIKVFALSPIRSIKIMGYTYLYYVILLNANRFIASIFFVQAAERYNYLLDAVRQATFVCLVLTAYFVARHFIRVRKITMRLSDNIFVNVKKDLILFILTTSSYYILVVGLPLLIPKQVIADFLILFILILFFTLTVYIDISASQKAEIKNKEVHISSLSKGINEFSSVKHDFYNILHSYGGYLEIGDIERLKEYHASLLHLTTHAGGSMDLSRKMSENPALISLIVHKSEYAEQENVKMTISLQSSLEDLYIDNMDICRCIACLLDNAIEAAARSEEKKVFFTIEHKIGGSKLIIITNSTVAHVDVKEISAKGFTNKQGHQGVGLTNVRKIIDTYGNCTFQTVYYNHEFSAYIELGKR